LVVQQDVMKSKSHQSKERNEELAFSSVERLMTAEEVADRLRVKAETIRIMARAKKIKAIKIGKAWRFKESDIKTMLESQTNIRDGNLNSN
jgi:excisionase family DNA binding protein